VLPLRRLAAVAAVLAAVLGGVGAPVDAAAVPAPVTISGLDLHDGSVAQFGGTLYAYGTEYDCGFSWRSSSPWCGFGVSTAPSLAGPWSPPTLLFSPSDTISAQPGWADDASTWQTLCGSTGAGCFNPRMVMRTDGVYVLWFNAPADSVRGNGFYAMGCNGPTGGCGAHAGAPHGTTRKPSLWVCGAADGDFSVVGAETGSPVLMCGDDSATNGIDLEQLDGSWVNGDGTGSTNLAGLGTPAGVEGVGAYHDPLTGTWVMIASDPACGYCAGTGSTYATAPALLGPWSYPANLFQAGGPPHARAMFSASSCGGQPRTAFVLGGQPYEWIDMWTGTANEAGATVRLEPLTYTPSTRHAGDGQPWIPELAPYQCS
jgi:hypothetical protein